MSSSATGIEIHTEGYVRTITFARPERRNGMDLSMFGADYDALAEAESDDEVRAVVVTGARSSFCSGATPDLLAQLAGLQDSAEESPDDPRASRASSADHANPADRGDQRQRGGSRSRARLVRRRPVHGGRGAGL